MNNLEKEKINEFIRAQLPAITLFLMTGTYILLFSIISINKHNRFGTSGFDLGIFDQANWLISQGKTPFVTVRGLHIFGDHASYIHLLTAQLFHIWDDVRALLILQTVFLALGAVPIYFLAKDRLKNPWKPLIISLSYLLFPSLQHINLWQYHPESLGVPFLLFAFYFATKKNFRYYFVFVSLTLITKEEFSMTLLLLGLYVLYKYDIKAGIFTVLLSIVWLIIVVKFLLPHFTEFGYYRFGHGYNLFGRFGATPTEVAVNILLHPFKVVNVINTELNRKYLYNIFAPVAFLPLLSPMTLGIASFALFANLISDFHYMHLFNHHYSAILIPFIFISVVIGISNLKTRFLQNSALALLFVSSILGNVYLGPWGANLNHLDQTLMILNQWGTLSPGYETSADKALKLIPDNASVSATPFFVPQLTHRRIIYEFPNPFVQANWGVSNENPPPKDVEYIFANTNPLSDEEMMITTLLLKEGLFVKIFDEGGIVLLKSSYEGPLDKKYGTLIKQMDPYIKDLAVQRKDYPTCIKINSSKIKEECYKDVGVATNDYNLCDVRIGDQNLRDECFNKIGIQTNDWNLCAVKIASQRLKDECFRDVGIQTGDMNLCLTRISSESLKAECIQRIKDVIP